MPLKLNAAALSLIADSPIWAIRDETALLAVLEGAEAPQNVAVVGDGRPSGLGSLATAGPVAVIPVHGVITHRASWFTQIMGWTPADMIRASIGAALTAPAVRSIVLDVASPGGSVSGVPELADYLASVRGRKPIIAAVNAHAASAAYWLAASADRIVVTPSGEVGSVGVVALHVDQSRADASAGLKYTIVRSPKDKFAGNPHEPIDAATVAEMQAGVDRYFAMFLKSVARGRGTSVDRVATHFGQGRMVGATEAIARGMADAVQSFPDLFDGLLRAANVTPSDRRRHLDLLASDIGALGPDAQRAADRSRRLSLLARSLTH